MRRRVIMIAMWLLFCAFPFLWTAAFVLALPFNFLEGNSDDAFDDFKKMLLSRSSWKDFWQTVAHPVRMGLFR